MIEKSTNKVVLCYNAENHTVKSYFQHYLYWTFDYEIALLAYDYQQKKYVSDKSPEWADKERFMMFAPKLLDYTKYFGAGIHAYVAELNRLQVPLRENLITETTITMDEQQYITWAKENDMPPLDTFKPLQEVQDEI